MRHFIKKHLSYLLAPLFFNRVCQDRETKEKLLATSQILKCCGVPKKQQINKLPKEHWRLRSHNCQSNSHHWTFTVVHLPARCFGKNKGHLDIFCTKVAAVTGKNHCVNKTACSCKHNLEGNEKQKKSEWKKHRWQTVSFKLNCWDELRVTPSKITARRSPCFQTASAMRQ